MSEHSPIIKVLYVDDEVQNLQSFKANFRHEFDITTAGSALEALQAMQNEQFHVVVSDNRMPHVTGIEFLEQLLHKYPEPARILLTAYSDINSVVNAINKSHVFSYIDKPWDSITLREAILHGFEYYKKRESQKEELEFFVYKASHDLRGPLSSMKSLLDMAQNDEEDLVSMKSYLSLIDKSLGHLMNTLNELIEYKKLDRSAVSKVNVDFQVVLQEIIESLKNLEKFKSIHFSYQVHQDHQFINDISIVRSILQNLIHNAINYSRIEEGHVASIHVKVNVNDYEADIEVTDNGMGMTEKTLQKVFDMFYRNHFESTGSGLGLYIVKKGIEKLDGKISVQSKFREGTSFFLTIPCLPEDSFESSSPGQTIQFNA